MELGTALQMEEQGGIAPEIALTPESPETVRLPHGHIMTVSKTTSDEVEHSIHSGIF